MGVIIPQVITSDRATGAQVIDGSLKFDDDNKQFLKKTFSSGNSRTWTWSAWIKRDNFGSDHRLFTSDADGNNQGGFKFTGDQIQFFSRKSGTFNINLYTAAVLRDTGWYHLMVAVDTTISSPSTDRVKLYVNGALQTIDSSYNTYPSQNYETRINTNIEHLIGRFTTNDSQYMNGAMSQIYLIDGQALGPEYFGFTDPLTNTWRPKKYINTTASSGDAAGVVGFGTNGFYLPMDGNSPIGQDQSGQGNNWTPVNFGGSVALDNPQVSGARPILNTTQGGTQAGVGVFGSKENVGYAVTYYDDGGGNKYYIDGVKQATLTGLIRGATYTFDTVALGSTHPFRFSDSDGGSEYTNGVAAITGTATTITIPYDAPETLYYYCTAHSGMGSSITGITTNEKLADQYASHCTLALPLVGANSDVSASIACTMTNKAVTSDGNVAASSVLSNFYSGSFYFEGTDNILTIPDNSDFSFGSGDYTIEMWVYPTRISGTQENLITRGTSGFSGFIMSVTNFLDSTSGSAWDANITYDNPLVANKWQHIAVCRYGDTWTVYINGVANGSDTASGSVSASGTLTIGGRTGQTDFQGYMNDVRLYKGVAKYTSDFVVPSTSPDILPDTPSGVAGGSKLTKITDGAVNIVKASTSYLDVSASSDFRLDGEFCIEYFVKLNDFSNDSVYARTFVLDGATGDGGSNNIHLNVNPSTGNVLFWNGSSQRIAGTIPISGGWHHVALTRDSSNDIRLFVDGRISGTDSSNTTDFNPNSGSPRPRLGGLITGNNGRVDGTFSNWRIVKGSAIYTSTFTPPTEPLTNVTNTKLLCCQSNTSATEAAVTPGSITANGDAVATNFNPFNTDINTVRGQETGYNTLNPLAKANISLSDGNLALTHSGTNGNWQLVLSTIGMSSGKFYCEFLCQDADSVIGIAKGNHVIANDKYVGQDPGGYSYNGQNGQKLNNSSGSSYGSSYAAGDLIGIAFDGDNGTLRFYKNNVDQGQAFSGLTDEYFFAFSIRDTGYTHSVNFGQKPFKFPPPDGFQPLNAANIRPVKVIARPDQYVGVTTYTGTTGTGTIKDDNINFTPDFVWLKSRSNSEGHALYDTVRGSTGGNFYRLRSDTDTAQNSPTNELSSMIEGGFTVNNNGHCYFNGYTYVAWCWKAGGEPTATNTQSSGAMTANSVSVDGVLQSAYTPSGSPTIYPKKMSVGTKQGFSIVQYVGNDTLGATLPHGLTKAPDFFVTKASNYDNREWQAYHKSLGNQQPIRLNTNQAAQAAHVSYFNNTSPTANVVTFGNGGDANQGGETPLTYIMYAWHDVPGLQKFGSFTGNGSQNFVSLDFRPALVWVKRAVVNSSPDQTNDYASWTMMDFKRLSYNGLTPNHLFANKSSNEGKRGNGALTTGLTDMTLEPMSNGFYLNGPGTEVNANTGTYIYCAWAEAPTVDLFGGGANAR